ncbi:hypothetical protein ACWEFD_17845 [Streptomyces ardesiacus]
MHLLPTLARRHLKRWRFARTWRRNEAFLFQCAPAPTWSRVRRINDAAHVWRRFPERPRGR